MAIDLNKNKGENSNSRFNLSKSGESSAAGIDKSQIDQPKRKFDLSKPKDNVSKTSSNELSSSTSTPKRKSNNRVFFVLSAIICVAALFWIFTNKENSSNNQDVAAVQPDLKEQITPVSQSTTNSGGENLKEAEISPTSNPSPEPAQTTESNPSGTELGNAPNTKVSANTDIPYKKDETYKVYQFPFGVSDYSQADPELDKLAEVLTKNPGMNISISAYTDDIGDEAYNLALSELRAKSIRNYLVNKGIQANRMKFQGKGISTKFAAKADNRRAEFILSN